MKKLTMSATLIFGFTLSAPVHAGLLQPGAIPISVACGQVIKATDDAESLTLDADDPVVSAPCDGHGITIQNAGSERSFELDCSYLTLQGAGAGVGVRLRGPNLTVRNCMLAGFGQGITAGPGATIEDCRITDSIRDGLVLRNPQSPNSENFAPITVVGTRSRRNGGWGFSVQGNGSVLDVGSVFGSTATGNRKGGFLVKGNGNEISGCLASDNAGPGFAVRGNENSFSGSSADGNLGTGIEIATTRCCETSFLETASASGNAGPGILFIGRANPANGGFPTGLDTTPGNIDADANGPCPEGSLPNQLGSGVCPVVKGRTCTVAELEECGIIPPPPAECGNGVVEPPLETCEPGVAEDDCPGDCDPTTCTCHRN